jgi:DNA-binding NarL/FixJ family response regulator
MRARVLLAERETLVREGLERLLRDAFRVVGSVADALQLAAELERLRPDVLVTGLPELVRGVGAIRGLRRQGDARVVVVGPDSPQLAAQAFASGASGWVLRTSPVAELIEAVSAAALGHRFLTREIAGGDPEELEDPVVDNRIGEVTPRGVEVVRLLAQGKRMKEAAADLGITTRTVAFHKYRTMKALGIDSSAELVRYAVRNRMV